MVILVDEEDRENEGDLVLAADHVTPEAINFMARFGRGLICLTLTRERCERLHLVPMTSRNGQKTGTAFTVSIEAAEGVTTGISAADRARTVQAAVARNASARDLVQPGHIFPLQAQDGGVLMRAGHTEAGCDLVGHGRPDARRGDLRDHEGRRHDGAAARPDRVRARAPAEDRHHRRPDRVPQPQRVADRTCRLAQAGHRAGRVRAAPPSATAPAACTWR